MTNINNNGGIGRFASIRNIGHKDSREKQHAAGAIPKEEPANEPTNLNNDPNRINGLYIVKKAETRNIDKGGIDPKKVQGDVEHFRKNADAIMENEEFLNGFLADVQEGWVKNKISREDAETLSYIAKLCLGTGSK